MGKCRFYKVCKEYMKDCITCNKNDGYYYGKGRGGGCYRKFEELENKNKLK